MTDYYSRVSTVRAGLKSACPRCGEGALYTGILTVRDSCAACGLDYGRLSGEDGAAFFVIVGYSALVIPLAVWFEFALTPPIWLHAVIWIPVVIGGSILLLRPLKAWMIAQQYVHKAYPDDPAD